MRSKEENASYMKSYRKRNKVTGSVTETVTHPVDVTPELPSVTYCTCDVEHRAIWLAINGITERLDRIEAVQAKAVTLGVSVPRKAEKYAFSKESQAHGHMPDNSPLGRMYRGTLGSAP